jgi:hypothetical protein
MLLATLATILVTLDALAAPAIAEEVLWPSEVKQTANELKLAATACNRMGCREVRSNCEVRSGFGGNDRVRCNRGQALQPAGTKSPQNQQGTPSR